MPGSHVIRRIAVLALLGLLGALALPAVLAPIAPLRAATAGAQTTQNPDGAIVGVSPGWNLDANDATLGPDIATYDSCTGSNSAVAGDGASPPSYLPSMNAWQGKANTVINFYEGFDTTSAGNIFGYSNPCNNAQFVPWIWNNYDAVPMQTGEMAPPETAGACADGTTNPYACFTDSNGAADNAALGTFGQTLNEWLNGKDAFGNPAPANGRRYYIRFNWEGNGTWVPWGPAYVTLATSQATYVPVYADDCNDLFNEEMLWVAWWRHVRNTVDSYIHPIGTSTVNDEVSWVYSQFAYSPLTLTNDLGTPYFPAGVQDCAPRANTVYSTSRLVHPSDLIEAMYPGDDVTNWTGLDGYAGCSPTNASQLTTNPTNLSLADPSSVFGTYVSDLHSFTTRPVSIDEVGVSTRSEGVPCQTPAQKDNWIAQYMQFVQDNNVRMSIWFNDDESSADGGVDDDAVFCNAGLDAECSGTTGPSGVYTGTATTAAETVPAVYLDYSQYRQGLQSSWWETPDPSLGTFVNGAPNTTSGRVMDNASFEGTWTTGTSPGAAVISATGGEGQVSLVWSTPNDGGNPITGYELYRGTTSGGEALYQSLPAATNSYVDTAVTAATTYYYEVKAVNAVGAGPPSNEASAMPTSVPGAPGQLTASFQPGPRGSVALSWDPADPNGSPITGYELYRGTSPGSEVAYVALPSETTYTDTGTKPGTVYYYEVAAVNADGTGPRSNEASARA